MTAVRELRAEIVRSTRRMRRLVAAIAAKIEELPDNPRIRRISRQAFVIQTSALGNNWSPEHHDFKHQYRAVVEAIKAVPPAKVMSRLRTIVRTGEIRRSKAPGDTVKLHKDVVAYLETLLEVKRGKG